MNIFHELNLNFNMYFSEKTNSKEGYELQIEPQQSSTLLLIY